MQNCILWYCTMCFENYIVQNSIRRNVLTQIRMQNVSTEETTLHTKELFSI